METKMLRWTAEITQLDHIRIDVIRERFGVVLIVTRCTKPDFVVRSVTMAILLSTLIEETQRISYHVIDLSETKRKGPLTCTWSNGNAVFFGARSRNNIRRSRFHSGTDFTKNVTTVTFHSHRLGILTATLAKDFSVSTIQVYAFTSDSDEDQHEDFYDDLGELAQDCTLSEVMCAWHECDQDNLGRLFLTQNALKAMIDDASLDMISDINEEYDQLLNTISTLASQSRIMAPNHNFRRISDATRILLAQRRQMDTT
ncbi:hypothetical protein TELCIR_00438 [Teladorsagia circumcincta]|uniref:Uncharacterized protein n=1 Tax=Teladorsagia circumcincta TaxID=45464 RepID=A0A2G9V4N8_TELCI|nr:hypothetical protein TELCIR_00438 [Teladorsagia circumcincta]